MNQHKGPVMLSFDVFFDTTEKRLNIYHKDFIIVIFYVFQRPG